MANEISTGCSMSHATYYTLGSSKFSLRSVENGNSNVGVTVRLMPQPMLLLRRRP
jgi:hypothetical protein